MIIKHDRHVEKWVRKGLWACFLSMCFSAAGWLGRQTSITWKERERVTEVLMR